MNSRGSAAASSKSGINALQRLPGSDISIRDDGRFNGNTRSAYLMRIICEGACSALEIISRQEDIHLTSSDLARRSSLRTKQYDPTAGLPLGGRAIAGRAGGIEQEQVMSCLLFRL